MAAVRSQSTDVVGVEGVLLAARPEDLLWFEWEGEGIFSLYDRGTGETHILDMGSAEVLRALCRRPADWPRLTACLLAEGVLEPGAEWEQWLRRRLEGLMALELIAPADQ